MVETERNLTTKERNHYCGVKRVWYGGGMTRGREKIALLPSAALGGAALIADHWGDLANVQKGKSCPTNALFLIFEVSTASVAPGAERGGQTL